MVFDVSNRISKVEFNNTTIMDEEQRTKEEGRW